MTAATAIGMRNPGDDVAASRASGCGGSQKQDMITLNVSARQCQKRSGSIPRTRRSQAEYSLEQYADNGIIRRPHARLPRLFASATGADPAQSAFPYHTGRAQVHCLRPVSGKTTTAALTGITGKERITCDSWW